MKRTLFAFAAVAVAVGCLALPAEASHRQPLRLRQNRHHAQAVVAVQAVQVQAVKVQAVVAPVYAAPVLQLQAAPVYSQQFVAPAAVVAPGCAALFVK